ncbi:MAG: M36 family metallopeptidase [Bryobacterales bacterium]|nr:M36 family metallopeptidase [Bryobacterales bacterium]
MRPSPADRVADDFDSREAAAAPALPSATLALKRLEAETGRPLQARMNPLSGGVRLLRGGEGIAAARMGTPAEIARAFLGRYYDLFGLNLSDLAGLVETRNYSGLREAVTHLVFSQYASGIPVFGSDIRFHVDRAGRIVFLSSSAVPLAAPNLTPALPASMAVIRAAADVRPELVFAPRAVKPASGPAQSAVFARGPFRSDFETSLVLFPVPGGARLAWQVSVEPVGFPQKYITLVDAVSGEILYRHNLVRYADGVGNVLQSDATMAKDPRQPDQYPAGTGNCPPVMNLFNRQLNAQFRDPATVLFDTGRLSGNNGAAYRVSSGAFGAQGTKDGSGIWHFDFAFNTASAAETDLFFEVNFTHDFFYDLGFDEPSGNFQENNFGRGGLGSDGLNANARASGRNNANFSTPSDGQNPTMNMFLWDGAGCWAQDVDGDGSLDLDGTIDYDIVLHEYHHGVTYRMNTGWGGNEGGAMGEGGGDFFAYSVNGDTKLADFAAPPDGIRQINGKTYGDWYCPFRFYCPVHTNGEIWANVLWDAHQRYRSDLVGGSDAAAIQEIRQTYMNGIKLSPSSPTMLEMRDAMLQDDLVRHPSGDPGGSVNYCRLWEVFAGRGMGLNARDTKDTGTRSVVENFEKPAACQGTPEPPAAPTGLGAGAVSSSQINLTWTDNSDNEQGFKIERCQGAGCSSFAQIATAAAGATSYGDTGLAANTTYGYRVRAYNTAGDSGYSNVAEATTQQAPAPPAAPTGLNAAAVSSSQINLAWTDNSGNEQGFKIERCQGAGCSNFAQVATAGAGATGYSDTGLAANTTYRYRVRAYNTAGDSGYSNEAEATTQEQSSVPAAPSSLNAAAGASGFGRNKVVWVNLTWSDNSDNETSFIIERCSGAGCSGFSQIGTAGAGATAYKDETVARNTEYSYRVKAHNNSGDSGYSNTASAKTSR